MKKQLAMDGIQIYQKGNIQRGAVVFLHGSSLSALTFRKQFRAIDSFPMLAIDLPGHGLSDRATDPGALYNIPAYARAVAALISKLELSDFILVGHSMGANVAIEASDLLPALRGLFLFNMSPFSLPPKLDKMCKPNPFLGYFLSGRLHLQEALLLAGEMVPANEHLAEELAEYILNTDHSSRMGFAASLGLDKFRDETSLIENFTKPLALILGKKERFINPEYLDAINPVSLWRNGIIKMEAGHVPQLEVPKKFNALLKEFYRDVMGPEKGGERGEVP